MAQGKEHIPTDEMRRQVSIMSGYGMPQEQIAIMIDGGITVETMQKYYSHELTEGKAKTNFQVAKSLYQQAINGQTNAAIFWAKTQMRWRTADSIPDEDEAPRTNNVVITVKGPDGDLKSGG